jgi:uncharacterized protein YqgV (UPF0045/DUF77 family)
VTLSAQVSLYPLKQARLGPAIEALLAAFRHHPVEVRVGPMSTYLSGEVEQVFAALREGFERAAALGPTVLNVTISDACPTELPEAPR